MENLNNFHTTNTTNKEKRKPVYTDTLQTGKAEKSYNFYCNNIAKLAMQVIAIIQFAKYNDIAYRILVSALWIVNHMANKLQGICSISSSVCDNLFCKARQKIHDCICKYCYANNQQAYQTGLKEHNILNGIILRHVLIPQKYFKQLMIVFPYLRIESFGDVENVIQARNYIRIIKAHKEKRCAIWSKNIAIWVQAFELEGKPDNTTYIHSSSFLNKPEKPNYNFIDHVFTVYTKKYAKDNNIVINCGGKKCMDCIIKHKNCYYKINKNNNSFYINELKK